MRFELGWGRSGVCFELEAAADILERSSVAGGGTGAVPDGGAAEAEIISSAMDSASISLSDFAAGGSRFSVVVSDQTRPTGADVYLPFIFAQLREAGASEITVILAQGLHRGATPSEIEKIFGGPVPDDVTVVNHDAENDLLRCGDAYFRREAVEADRLIITGAVTFHPMAGFSGGRKSLLPGVASADDIRKNHRLYFNGTEHNSLCSPSIVKDNPVRDDLTRRTSGFKNLWALNVVIGESKQILFASCGNPDGVWHDCCGYVADNFSVPFPDSFDNIISSAGGYPSDFSFYQSMKVLTNSARACREGGRLIILSECSNGWEIREEMLELFKRPLREVAGMLISDFRMDLLGLYMAMSIISRYEVWLYSSLPKAEVEASGMHYISSPEEIAGLTDSGSTAVIKNGSSILPVPAGQQKENK